MPNPKPNNHYDLLGVAPTATDGEIKAAWRTFTLKHHPDRGGAPGRFAEGNAAYDTLGDAMKRRAYDRTLAEAPAASLDLAGVVETCEEMRAAAQAGDRFAVATGAVRLVANLFGAVLTARDQVLKKKG